MCSQSAHTAYELCPAGLRPIGCSDGFCVHRSAAPGQLFYTRWCSMPLHHGLPTADRAAASSWAVRSGIISEGRLRSIRLPMPLRLSTTASRFRRKLPMRQSFPDVRSLTGNLQPLLSCNIRHVSETVVSGQMLAVLLFQG